jgi:hypothetical protein
MSNSRDSEPGSLSLQVHGQRRDAGPAAGWNVVRDGKVLDIDRFGLPTDSQIQLLAQTAGHD